MLGEVMTIARRLGGCLLTCFVPLACEQAQLRSGAHRVDLAIAKSANLAVAQEGDAIVYTVNVTNYGPIDATGVAAGDTLPTGELYITHTTTRGVYSPSTGLWTIGDLAAGASAALTLTVVARTGTVGTILTNRARVLSTDLDDSNLANNLATSIVRVTPPSADNEPVLNAGTDQMVYQDNMDGYTDAAAMWSDNSATPRMQQSDVSPLPTPDPADTLLSPGRGGTGHALRIAYSGVPQDPHGWHTVNVSVGQGVHSFMTAWARVTLSAPLITPLCVKWFMAFHPDGGGDRTQWSSCWATAGTDALSSFFRVNPQSRGEMGMQPLHPYFRDVVTNNDIAGGQWHRFTYEFLAQSALGARDGIARMWIDGIKVIDISAAALNITPPGGWKVWCTTTDLDN